jgi:hypothetical protein
MIHAPRAIVHFPDDGNLLNQGNIDALYDALQQQISEQLSPDPESPYDPETVAIIPCRFAAKRARHTAVFTVEITAAPTCDFLSGLDKRVEAIAQNVLNDCGWIKDMSGNKANIDVSFGDSRAIV